MGCGGCRICLMHFLARWYAVPFIYICFVHLLAVFMSGCLDLFYVFMVVDFMFSFVSISQVIG